MWQLKNTEPPEYSPSLKIISMNFIRNNKFIQFKCLIDETEFVFDIERKGEAGIVLPSEIIDIVTESWDRSRRFGSVLESFLSDESLIYPVEI